MYKASAYVLATNCIGGLTVSSAPEKDLCCLDDFSSREFSTSGYTAICKLWKNRLAGRDRLHYFSAIHKVRTHASYIDVRGAIRLACRTSLITLPSVDGVPPINPSQHNPVGLSPLSHK